MVKRNLFIYLVIIIFAVILFYPVFRPGYMIYVDNPNNYYELDFLAKKALPEGWINGWSMQAGFMGQPVLLYRPPVSYWLPVILSKLSGLSLLVCYKLMVVFTLAFIGSSIYALISYRFGWLAGASTAFLLMLQKDIYCDKILGGMWSNYIAIGLLMIFLHLLDKYIQEMDIKKAVLLGIIFSAVILTHLFTAIILTLVYIGYLMICLDKAWRFKWLYFLIPVIGGAIALFYIYPFFETRPYFREIAKEILTGSRPVFSDLVYGVKSLFGDLERYFSITQFLSKDYTGFLSGIVKSLLIDFPIFIRDILGVFGIVLFFKNYKSIDEKLKKFFATFFLIIVFGIFLYSDTFYMIPGYRKLPFVTVLESHRFIIYAHIGLFIFAGYAIFNLLKNLNFRKAIIFICLAVMFALSFYAHKNIYVNVAAKTFDDLPDAVYLKGLWSWVSKNVDPLKTRVVYQSTRGNIPDKFLENSDVVTLAGLYSDAGQIGGFSGGTFYPTEAINRTDSKILFGKSISQITDIEINEWMKRINAGFIVSCENILREKLSQSLLFEEVAKFGSYDAFRLKAFKPVWLDFKNSDTPFELTKFENKNIEAGIRNYTKDNYVTIKVAYHPYWKAMLNGKDADLEPDRYGLMKVSLPTSGYYKLNLLYNSKHMITVFVSAVSLLSALIILFLPKVKHA